MQVYWLEQIERDVPATDTWLGPHELDQLRGLTIPKRHADWRLGRWTAKRAIAECLQLPVVGSELAKVEICPEPSGAPRILIANRAAGIEISISHSSGTAICALANAGVRLGCDVESIEVRADAFLEDYFTKEEQAFVARTEPADCPRLVTFLWSAKESTLKAMKQGLRVDTRSVVVQTAELAVGNQWTRFEVRDLAGELFHGWCCESAGLVRTVVTDIQSEEPINLRIADPRTNYAADRDVPCRACRA